MRRRRVLLIGVLVAAGLPSAAAAPCFAIGAGPNTARIVIEHEHDSATFCVSFPEDAITGYEALRRTGIPIVAEEYGAGQVTVCRIGGIGCAHPTQPCFCECTGDDACTFWGYFRAHADDPWRFSEAGPAATTVRDGDREGWRYGPQTERGGNAPRDDGGVCVEQAAFLASATTEPSTGSATEMIRALFGIALFAIILLGLARRRRRA